MSRDSNSLVLDDGPIQALTEDQLGVMERLIEKHDAHDVREMIFG